MTPFCMWLGGGSHEMLMLEMLLGFTIVTVTALGGALGTEKTQADTTQLKSEVTRKHESREANTYCNRK